MMNKAKAIRITGGLSRPSKMPGKAYSIPAHRCMTGAKLRSVPGSICESCYALKGRYGLPAVRLAQARRFRALRHAQWVDAMVTLVTGERWFRWHDSGDLQGVWHLANIIDVCRRTPKTRHWLPTREYTIVRQYLDTGGTIPKNLVIRLSAMMFDGPAPEAMARRCGVQVSGASQAAYTCPAQSTGNQCADCRACWSRRVFNVVYHKH